MFVVIGFMFLGILTGFLLRRHRFSQIQKAITVLIWILLLIMGLEVGSNRTIIDNLSSLGIEALVISTASTLGSCVMAWVLWRILYKRKKKDSHER